MRTLCLISTALAVLFSPALLCAQEPFGPRVGRVLVVANSLDPASLELAREYMALRHLPPANLLRLPFADTVNIAPAAFQDSLVKPINRRLAELKRPTDFIVLMRGVPYRVEKLSVPSLLMSRGAGGMQMIHPYYQRNIAFDAAVPFGTMPMQLVTFISGYTVAETKALMRKSLVNYASPGSAGTFYLCEGKGKRSSRRTQIDQALAALEKVGGRGERIAGADLKGRMDVLAQFTGAKTLSLEGNRYLPGSIVDNMTSFGGYMLDPSSQINILTFVKHGACGAYGTVSEPTNSPARWADYSLAARYAAGFTLAESYYQTIRDFTFGLVVGDPLMAPFAQPPTVDISSNKEVGMAGQPLTATVRLREGRPGEGISYAELWLDDLVRVHTWEPELPIGTECTLKIALGDKVIEQKSVKVADEPEPLGAVLEAFAGRIGKVGQLARGGRNGDKLIMFTAPVANQEGQLLPAACELTISFGGKTAVAVARATTQPLVAHCAVIDLGTEQPLPGDRLSVTVGGVTRSAQAFATDNLQSLAGKLARYLAKVPSLQAGGQYNAQVRQTPGEPPGFQVLVAPKDLKLRSGFPISVSVTRVEGSNFAKHLDQSANFWRDIAVGGMAQAVLTPRVPIADAAFQVEFPAGSLCPGPHRLTCQAMSPFGSQTLATAGFEIREAPGQPEFGARFSPETLDPGDSLMIYMKHGESLAKAFPKLVIDDAVVCSWPAGTVAGQLPVNSPLVCPGPHDVWIEWFTRDGITPATEIRRPLARSAVSKIFVRRPMAAGLVIAKPEVPAGTRSIKISGPYLSDRARVMIESGALDIVRDKNKPLYWTVDISRLLPGSYQLSISGDAETDRAQLLPTELNIVRRPTP